MSDYLGWPRGKFRIRVGRKYEWRDGWMHGAFGVHSYRTVSEHGFEPIEVAVFALTHLPSAIRPRMQVQRAP
jgi:hypothetical protein